MLGRRFATYKVSQTGVQSFTTGTGSTFTAPYCGRIPSLAKADFQGAKILTAGTFNGVALSNEHPTSLGDIIRLANVTIDGGGKTTDKGYPLFILWGLAAGSDVQLVTVTNTSYIAGSVGACKFSRFAGVTAYNIRGQGIMFGNGLSDLNDQCSFVALTA